MQVVQVTGLPGAGKTTGIELFLREYSKTVSYIDIRHYEERNKEARFRAAINNATKPVIAESACGINIKSYVIRLEPPIQTVYKRLLKRDKFLDEDYLSLLHSIMIKPHRRILVASELPVVLQDILRSN